MSILKPSTGTRAAEGHATVPDPPRGRAGWWHEYVCQVHGTELLAHAYWTGGPHYCPHGCRLVGERLDAAWRVLEHQRLAREVRARAHRWARTGRPDDREVALRLLHQYRDLYATALEAGWSDSAQPWMLRGKLFHQALTEAIWGVSIADGICALAVGDASGGANDDLLFVQPLLEGLTATVDEARRVLVEDRNDHRNNYTAWLDCAAVTARRAAARLGLDHIVGSAPSATERVAAHAAVAVGQDGWEWEGATYYHFFVLRAYLIALADECPAGIPVDVLAPVSAMLRVLVDLATDEGTLPVLHDGPYQRRDALLEVVEVCVLGRQLVDMPGLAALEAGSRDQLDSLGPGSAVELVDHLRGWFGGPPVAAPRALIGPRGSVAFRDVGVLVLRPPSGRWQAVVDAGPHGGSHGHLDKLALYLYGRLRPWQPAPGVPPYGSGLRERYYQRTAAHPTLRVDGEDQQEATGQILHWQVTATGAAAVVAADDAFPGVFFRRHLRMEGDLLLDAINVRSAESRRLTVGLRPGVPVQMVVGGPGGVASTYWDAGPDSRLEGKHVCTAPSVFGAVPVRGPSDDPARNILGVDWEAVTNEAWFVSLYTPAGSSRRPSLGLDVLSTSGALVASCSRDGRSVQFRIDAATTPSAPPELIDEEAFR